MFKTGMPGITFDIDMQNTQDGASCPSMLFSDEYRSGFQRQRGTNPLPRAYNPSLPRAPKPPREQAIRNIWGPNRMLLHEHITRAVIGCGFEVINELGAGFLESVYQNAMLLTLRENGMRVKSQHPIQVKFRGACVGAFFANLLVEERVIVELKAVKAILPEHQAQGINYLKATGIEVGLLFNFGRPKLEYRRFTRDPRMNMDIQDRQD